MTQEEIVSSTKTVAQGLEALRSEHQSILQGLNGSLKAAAQEKLDSNVIEEKANLIKKSLDMIELGLGEAQVKTFTNFPQILHISDNQYICVVLFVLGHGCLSNPFTGIRS